MTFDLLEQFNLLQQYQIYQAIPCTDKDLNSYHNPQYIQYMKSFHPDQKPLETFKIGTCNDVPAFNGFYEFSKLTGGSSLMGANLINSQTHQIVLNWIGGFHHAKKNHASGFCYINDCVLAINRMLTTYDKVLYIDIDVHHGDGVEEAFLYNDRVLTLSFH